MTASNPSPRRALLALLPSVALAAACADQAPLTDPAAGPPAAPSPAASADSGTPRPQPAAGGMRGVVGIALLGGASAADSAGRPGMRGVGGVTIAVYALAADSTRSATPRVAEVTSGADGAFTVPVLPAGTYQLFATPPAGSGHGVGHIWVTVPAGGAAPTNLRIFIGGDRPSGGNPTPRDSTAASTPPRDSAATPADTTPRAVRGYVGVAATSRADSAAASATRVADVTVIVLAVTPADSTTGRPPTERELARTVSGTDGRFTTPTLRSGSYVLRAVPPQGSPWRRADRPLWVPPGGLAGEVAVLLGR
jgi:hypothetical protein